MYGFCGYLTPYLTHVRPSGVEHPGFFKYYYVAFYMYMVQYMGTRYSTWVHGNYMVHGTWYMVQYTGPGPYYGPGP